MSKTKKVFGKIYRVMDVIRTFIIITTFSFIVLLCLYQVITRYFSFLNIRMFAWGDEIIRMTSIWVAYMAASLGVREGAHLSVDIVVKKFLPKKAAKIIKIIASLIVLGVMALLTYHGIKYTAMNSICKLLNVNMARAWFYAALPIGAIYLFVEYLIILVFGENPFIKHNDTDSNDDAEIDTYIEQLASNEDLDNGKTQKATKKEEI